jgi:hypothetical protein
MKSPSNDYALIRESFQGKPSFSLGANNKFDSKMMSKDEDVM